MFRQQTVIFRPIKNIFKVQQSSTELDFLERHCRLKKVSAQHFSTLILESYYMERWNVFDWL